MVFHFGISALQYLKMSVMSRIDGRGGLMKDELGQRGPLFKLVLYAGLALVFAGIVWGVVSALDEPPPDESQPEDVPGEVAPK